MIQRTFNARHALQALVDVTESFVVNERAISTDEMRDGSNVRTLLAAEPFAFEVTQTAGGRPQRCKLPWLR